MRILVTNDDGIYSPGIAALARVASRFGEVRVVAPDVEQSGASHAVTPHRPVSYRPTPAFREAEAYRVNGTPADCVALGVNRWSSVELVLSGVNLGLNVGNGIWHSGTVAAVKQAALLGIRGIAFSTPVTGDEPNFEALDAHVERVLGELLPEDHVQLVNVNIPAEPRGIRWTRQYVGAYDGKVVPDTDPAGREIYWFTVVPIVETEPDSDIWALERDLISITPLRLNLTDEPTLEHLRERHPLGDGTGA
jgi:5'-nucleotidase